MNVMPHRGDPNHPIGKLFALLHDRGHEDYFGEPVSQLEHACQCAQIAEENGCDEEIIIAALLHDIGHLCALPDEEMMAGLGALRHEQSGAIYLRNCGFSEKICQLVEGHVQAKRYLTFKDSHYFEQLSEASRQTLRQQGGRMTAEEAETFENHPLFGLMVNLRLWDEAAKIVDQPRPDLDHYEAMCLRHVENNLVAAPLHSSPL